MANRITTFFSFKEEGTGLKKIKADIQGVDGAWSKVKVGFKSSINEFRQSNTAQAAAVGALGAAAVKAIGYASDLEESVNAVQVTFGDAADEILAIGENSAESFGLSQSAFNGFAVQFSAFAQQIAEQDGRKVSEVIEEMTTRTADFASVQNLDLARAGEIVMSTMAGETEAFRRYGGDVSAATIKTYAYANGIAEAGTELTEGQKVLARYGAFMEQTDKVSGDFANTSDSLANSQRIAAAKAEDLAASFGEKLAPAMEGLVDGGLALMEVIEAIHLDDLLGVMNQFDDAALSTGRTIRGWFDGGEAHRNREFADSANKAIAAVKGFDSSLLDGVDSTEAAKAIIDEYAKSVDDGSSNLNVGAVILAEWAGAQREAAEAAAATERAAILESEALRDQAKANEHTTTTLLGTVDAHDDAAAAAKKHAQRIEDITEAFSDLNDEMSDREAWYDVLDAVDDFEDAVQDAEDAEAEFGRGSREAAAASRDMERALIDRVQAIMNYVEEAESIPAEKVTEIKALLDAGSVAEAEAILAQLERSRTATITARTIIAKAASSGTYSTGTTTVRQSGSTKKFGATGGIVNQRTDNITLGEDGPEAVIPLDKSPGNEPLGNLSVGRGGVTFAPGAIQVTAIGSPTPELERIVMRSVENALRRTGRSI